jgi:DNA repair protein RecN (Recombination protein N)
MLLELHIRGLGVIGEVTLELPPGLSVLTGETGAGKTMVTTGLALVLGRRAQSGLVQEGARRAAVEARFEADGPAAEEWADEGDLILARTIGADGRSTARAGGQIAPLSTLAQLGERLVEVHGQHSAQRLLVPGAQLAFLDRFCGAAHIATLDAYRGTHGLLRDTRARLARIDDEAREREREKDLLAYQVREIEAAGLRSGEVEELEREASRLEHAERLRERASVAAAAMGDEGGAVDALRAAGAALSDASGADPTIADLAGRVMSLAEEAGDAAGEAKTYAEVLDLDPARLEEIRERIAAIRSLERKYGEGEDAVLAFLERSRNRLDELDRATDERASLVAEATRLEAEAGELAASLSAARREAAPRLAAALESELHELGMPGATVDVELASEQELGAAGAESARLLFSGGSGQPPQPLERTASGGELSRTMLACRTVLADLDDVPTLVFDEVDSGIGGRAGVAVGRRLARLAKTRQVLVVTHLPQIACFADRHFLVTKEQGTARVEVLEGAARIDELSRMLSGMPTEEAATHAEQLLAEAAKEKAP